MPRFTRYLLLLFLSISGNRLFGAEAPTAEAGILDLSHWNWYSDDIVTLEGEWTFYWNELIPPKKIDGTEVQPDYIQVPGSWNNLEIEGKDLDRYGYATYRLKVRLHDQKPVLALRLPPIRSAFTLWVNSELVAKSGSVGKSKENAVPAYSPGLVAIHPDAPTLDLVIHVSNFRHRNAGIGFGIELGLHDKVSRVHRNESLYEIFLMAMLFIMGFYHFGLYWLRKGDRYTLYFGLFCVAAMIRVPLEGQYIYYQIFPDQFLLPSLKLDYLTILFMGLFFCRFLYEMFREEWHPMAMKALTAAALVLNYVILFLPISQTVWTIPLAQIIVLLGAMYTGYTCVLAVIRRRQGAVVLLIAMVIFTAFYINDLYFYSNQVHTGVLTTSGSIFLILSQSILLSTRYAKAFSLTEVYAKTFQKFVPKQFLVRIAKDGIHSIELGNAEKDQGVILFSDIRGFTAISEQLTPG
ncbi:MAG: 7TM diverse intracellular signaling domain-containing protein, partial [Bacteroidota bacterium]